MLKKPTGAKQAAEVVRASDLWKPSCLFTALIAAGLRWDPSLAVSIHLCGQEGEVLDARLVTWIFFSIWIDFSLKTRKLPAPSVPGQE